MDKQQQDMALALSQLLRRPGPPGLASATMRRLMPFLVLQRGARTLVPGIFSQANRLVDLTWGEPHITHVARESRQWHQHTHLTSHHYHPSGNQSKPGPGRNAAGQPHYTTNENVPPASTRTGTIIHSRVTQRVSADRSKAHSTLTGLNRKPINRQTLPTKQITGAVSEPSIINHSLVFRPFFMNTAYHAPSAHHSRQPGQAKAHGHPGLMGLLNSPAAVRRSRLMGNTSIPDEKNLSTAGSQPAPASVSWHMAPDNFYQIRQQDQVHPGNPVLKTPLRFDAGKHLKQPYPAGTVSITPENNSLRWRHDHKRSYLLAAYPGLQHTLPNPSITNKSDNPLPLLPVRLPHKRIPTRPDNGKAVQATELSKPLVEKIERLIEQKIITETGKHQHDKLLIKSFKTELQASLKPERFISDEMIRVLRKKLQKTITEERFRLGMLS